MRMLLQVKFHPMINSNLSRLASIIARKKHTEIHLKCLFLDNEENQKVRFYSSPVKFLTSVTLVWRLWASQSISIQKDLHLELLIYLNISRNTSSSFH